MARVKGLQEVEDLIARSATIPGISLRHIDHNTETTSLYYLWLRKMYFLNYLHGIVIAVSIVVHDCGLQ